MDVDWAFKLMVTGMIAVIAFFLKRSLDRIETKLDTLSVTQAAQALLNLQYDNRIKHLEEKVQELRDAIKDMSEGVIR